jgi:hypothetical protein
MLDFNKHDNDWENTIPLNAYRSKSLRLRRLVNQLFEEVKQHIKVSSKHRQKEALKTVLTNLLQAHYLGKMVRYSRDRNRYTRNRRYRKLFFTYDRLIPVIDSLETLGYIEQKGGIHYIENEYRKQTRMWPTDKLLSLFYAHRISRTPFFIPEQDKEDDVIILRNKKKQDIGYRETKQTKQMREDLERYNTLVLNNKISLQLNSETIVDNQFLAEEVCQYIHNGKIWIKDVQFCNNSNNSIYSTTKLPLSQYTNHLIKFTSNPRYYINNILDNNTDTSSITQMKRSLPLLRVLLQRFWSDEHKFEKYLAKLNYEISNIPKDERQDVLSAQFTLLDIGVEVLEIVMDHEQVHRIFNRKSWELGGRAYGALHQSWVRREMRKDILIDGVPTVEIDFSGFHILMLYHIDGIDYQEDPYLVEGLEMRDTYKAVGLVAINAKTPQKAYGGIRDELKDRGIPLPQRKEPLKSLVREFRKAHPDIADHLFSDVGVKLQNIDSHMMNAILSRFMDKGILGLSVHDSVIVQAQHKDLLRDIMTEEYRLLMGFDPKF